MEIKYDQPIEVTKDQYKFLMTNMRGLIAGREGKKYYIKLWVTKYKEELNNYLNG